MKSILFLLVTVSAFAANARLHSHMGTLTKSGGFTYACSFTNKTDNSLDMKYVIFSLESRNHRGETQSEDQTRIDRVVRTGETLVMKTQVSGFNTATGCRYIAR